MTFAPNNIYIYIYIFLIIKSRHQLIFGVSSKKNLVFEVDGDQALNLLFNNKRFYQLS